MTSVVDSLQGASAAFEMLQQRTGDASFATAIQVIKNVAGDVKRLGLETAVGTSHTTDRSYMTRMRW